MNPVVNSAVNAAAANVGAAPVGTPYFFYGLAAVAILSGLLVITRRNAVHSALALIVTLLSVAGLYLMLYAPFVAGVVHQSDCDRPTRRHTMIDPGIHDHPVGLELLPLSPAMPPLPALQLAVDHRGVERHAGGEPFHDGGERLAVRFTGGQIAEHVDLPGEGMN